MPGATHLIESAVKQLANAVDGIRPLTLVRRAGHGRAYDAQFDLITLDNLLTRSRLLGVCVLTYVSLQDVEGSAAAFTELLNLRVDKRAVAIEIQARREGLFAVLPKIALLSRDVGEWLNAAANVSTLALAAASYRESPEKVAVGNSFGTGR